MYSRTWPEMSRPVIKVDGLSKAYRLGSQTERGDTLAGALAGLVSAPLRNLRGLRRLDTRNDTQSDDTLWALNDVSFEVQQGETLGIVGRNGAGKSTLLKILSRITPPTHGRAEIHGRVSSLLEVGTGFHPELSGHENIFLNGSILGMRRAEIQRKYDEIVAFSGVERFLGTPVKRYSSGMKVRLAFAVAAHLEPEILIIDEVLAVGDAEFQAKCLGKMQGVAQSGRTVLFVSHNMGAVQSLCGRALALRNGELVDGGEPADVVSRYLAQMRHTEQDAFALDNPERTNTGVFRWLGGQVLNSHGEATQHVIAGEEMTLELSYESECELRPVFLRGILQNQSGVSVASVSTRDAGFEFHASQGRGVLRCRLPRLPLAPGDYRIDLSTRHQKAVIDALPAAIGFSVTDSVFFPGGRTPKPKHGLLYLDQTWSA